MEWLYAADDYEPGPGFRQDIEYSYHISGDPAPYVPSGYLRPDYTALGRSQMEYYYHFRDCIRRGEYPETDRGYIWLALCEVLVAETDPGRAMAIAEGMLEAYGRIYPCNVIISTFLYDYAISHDMPLPVTRFAPGSDINEAMICTQMCGPSFDLSLDTLYMIGAYDDRAGRLDQVEYGEYLNRALEALDSDSRHIRGYGIMEWYGNSRKEVAYTVFEDYGCVGETRSFLVDYPALFSNESFPLYIEAVSKHCAKRLLGPNNGAPKVPQYLDQSSREILDTVFDEMRSGRPRIPRDSMRNPSTVRYREGDPATRARGAYTPQEEFTGQSYEDDIFVSGPTILINTTNRRVAPDDDTLENMRRFLDVESDIPVEYIPSGFDHPDPVIIGDRARAYYVYWRTMCRRGTFLDVDSGYMWMYLTELVNFPQDVKWTSDHLVQMSDAYGHSMDGVVPTTALEFALCHNLRVPRNEMVDNPPWNSILLYRFLGSNPVDDLTLGMFRMLCTKLDSKYLPSPREEADFTATMNHALRSADAFLRDRDGRGLFGMMDRKPSTIRRMIYRDLYYKGDNRVLHFNYNDCRSCKELTETVTGIFKTALMVIRKKAKMSHPRIPTDFDHELRDHVERSVSDLISGRPERTRRTPPIVIDRDLVRDATEDLQAVTDMMAVPEDDAPDEAPAVKETVTEPVERGWSALASALDGDCKGYIVACLDGDGRMFAKGRGLSVSILEGRINDTAMDLVDDIIVEDGVVIEDYIDDVKDLLDV